jgi:type IV secretion system protein VirB6
MPGCQVVPGIDGFAPGVVAFLDCQARTLGAEGYRALAAPGSTASVTITVLLTLFIALIGYRMLFGQTPTVRDGVLSFVKIGIVLALASGWPAYQTLIYDTVLRGPAELMAEVGAPAGLPGSGGGLVQRLDGTDRAFQSLAIEGVGQPPAPAAGQAVDPQTPPPLFAGFDTFALGASRVAFLAGAIGAFALVRLGSGLLLALGPLFIGCLLFEGTRGLFEGWARALIGAALGALATAIALGVELALLEPWLVDLLARRAANDTIAGAPAQLLAIALVFVLLLLGLLALAGRVAMGLRLPIAWPSFATSSFPATGGSRSALATAVPPTTGLAAPINARSRAATIADAVVATQRRESGAPPILMTGNMPPNRAAAVAASSTGALPASGVPLGQSYRRRTASRVSARAAVRDRSA